MRSSYRFRPALVVRMTGVLLVATALVFLSYVVVGPLLGGPGPGAGAITAVMLVVALLGVTAVAVLRAAVVTLDETGYRIRLVRGVGVRRERWTSVEDVVVAVVGGTRCVVLRLRDGRSTVVPLGVLAAAEDAFVRDLRAHLNRGHGYRPLPRRRA